MNKLPYEIKREVLIKADADTNPDYGTSPEQRSTEQLLQYGCVNIDKPKGPTSHQVSDFIQKILHINKSGHSGTLDPQVTGVLPIAFEKATRLVQTLLKAGKEYICIMHLHKEVDEKTLQQTAKKFTGRIKQLPPIKSSVKRQYRFRDIYYFNILEIDGKDVLFQVGCQAGTYIRKLCHDFGKSVGCGAHMAELRRTRTAHFDESTLTTLQDLTDAFHYYKNENNDKFLRKIIYPAEFAIQHLPKIWVFDTTVHSLSHGANLNIPGIAKLHSRIEPDQQVAVMTLKHELIALGKAQLTSEKIMKKDKGLAVKTEKVFIDPEVYPRISKNI